MVIIIKKWFLSNYGVPQWSNLGPIVYLIYVNDFPQNVNTKLILLVDDTKAIVKAKYLEDGIQMAQQ